MKAIAVYIIHLRALSHYCDSYCGLCGRYYDLCSYSRIAFASLRDGIAELEIGSNQLLVFDAAHEAQNKEDEIRGG